MNQSRGSDLKSLKTDQLTVNAFITSSLLICEVDILHYCNIGCHDLKLEVIEE